MPFSSLQQLLTSQLRDLYSAERQVLLIWPQLAQQVRSSALREAIESHRAETGRQLARLIEILDSLNQAATGLRSRGMEGLLVELLTQLAAGNPSPVRDAAILAGCQRVESYEMAGYSSTISIARALDLPLAVRLLSATLSEEEAARRRLEMIATAEIHPAAIDHAVLARTAIREAEAIPITSARSLRGGLRA
ncbi:MAG TPA: DUF892 family protein [Gemmatimonadales bacterium]|nr:DUF892 family protein [Gemmatimonadales bacterium]